MDTQEINLQKFKASLEAEQYDEITPVERALGYQLGEHCHAFDACAMITAGEIQISVGGDAKTYRIGDVFRLPAQTMHTEQAGPAGVQYLAGRRHVKTT